jgi:hypothetical protein
MTLEDVAFRRNRHCEDGSDEAIQESSGARSPGSHRFARDDQTRHARGRPRASSIEGLRERGLAEQSGIRLAKHGHFCEGLMRP